MAMVLWSGSWGHRVMLVAQTIVPRQEMAEAILYRDSLEEPSHRFGSLLPVSQLRNCRKVGIRTHLRYAMRILIMQVYSYML